MCNVTGGHAWVEIKLVYKYARMEYGSHNFRVSKGDFRMGLNMALANVTTTPAKILPEGSFLDVGAWYSKSWMVGTFNISN